MSQPPSPYPFETAIFRIWRGHPGAQFWEEFELSLFPSANVISCLMEIQKNPINIRGERVDPVVWEQGCLEEVCGSCSMLINGRPRQACTALIAPIIQQTGSNTITLAPFSKFPLVRDLIVDRSIMFENLKKVHAWIDTDGSFAQGPGPTISPEKQEMMYTLSTCMTCGCCIEACPQARSGSSFVGAQIFGQVELFNTHPIGAEKKTERLYTMMEKGGINDCGNAQNCARVCPKKIPLTEAITSLGLSVTLQALKDIFGRK